MSYNFRLLKPSERISVFIRENDVNGTLLTACQVGHKIELNSKQLFLQFL